MNYDMNDAELPRGTELIPDGSFVKVTMLIRRGGIDGQGEHDRGLLKAGRNPDSDVRMLDCEFTVVAGSHARRKFWQSFTVAGGKVDEQGISIGWKISKGIFRAMIDSALGLDPKDMSEVARAKRVLRGLSDLDQITFAAKLNVEPASDARYAANNRLERVILPGEPEYARIMAGEALTPQPTQRAPRAAATANTPPAWAATAAAPPGPAPRSWERPAMAPAATAQAAPPVPPPTSAGGPAWLNG